MTIDRVDAQRAARDREAKLTFLAEASAKLSSDLDYEATLTAVAEAAVPVVRGLVRDLARRRTACCARSRSRTPTPSGSRWCEELQERYPTDPVVRPGWLPGAPHRREPAACPR